MLLQFVRLVTTIPGYSYKRTESFPRVINHKAHGEVQGVNCTHAWDQKDSLGEKGRAQKFPGISGGLMEREAGSTGRPGRPGLHSYCRSPVDLGSGDLYNCCHHTLLCYVPSLSPFHQPLSRPFFAPFFLGKGSKRNCLTSCNKIPLGGSDQKLACPCQYKTHYLESVPDLCIN